MAEADFDRAPPLAEVMGDDPLVDVFEVTPHPDPSWDTCICRTWQNALAVARDAFEYWMELAEEPLNDFTVRIRAVRLRESEIPEDAS